MEISEYFEVGGPVPQTPPDRDPLPGEWRKRSDGVWAMRGFPTPTDARKAEVRARREREKVITEELAKAQGEYLASLGGEGLRI